MKIELFVSLLLFFTCLAQAAFIGNFDLKSTDLRLNSEVKATITFEEAQVTVPTLSISGTADTSLDRILSEDSQGVIIIKAPSLGVSSANSFVQNSGLYLTSAITSVLTSRLNLRSHAALGIAALGLLSTVRSDSAFEVQIIVQYPAGYRFNSIEFNLADGSVASSQQLNVGGLDINVGQSGSVDMKNVAIGSNVNINAPVSVTLSQIAISQDSTLDVQSNGDIFMSFLQGFEFYGSYSVKGNQVDLPANCSGYSQNNLRTGTCFNSNSGSLNAQSSSGTVTIRFLTADQVEGYCTNFATSDFVPPMPEVTPITTLPAQSWNTMNTSTWRGTARGYLALQSNQIAGVMTATKNSWNNPIMLLQDDGEFLPHGLNPSRRYRLTFSLKFGLDFTPNFNLTARIMAYDELNTFDDNEERGIDWSEDPKDGTVGRALVESDPLPLDGWTTTSWKTFSYEFTPSAMSQRAYAAVWISDFPDTTVSIKDVVFEVFETPYSIPNFYDGHYRAAYIPTMPVELESNPRQNCPHLQDGLKRWEDASTWPNGVPAAGSSVTLPANTKVLVGPCSFTSKTPFTEITVPESSELIFADAPIDMHVKTIWVNGALRMGSETCRLFSKISITFYGTRQETANMGKGIVVSETGTLDIHGKQYNPTWTRLAAPVFPGDTRIYLQHPVNWEAGQKIMLTTSGLFDLYYDMNEVLTIKSVNQKVVDLVTPALRYHHAGPEYQNEVALLTRRILLQGAEDSVSGAFGGHVMIMGEGRVRGVETFRMGQNNTLARYPLHFHMMGVAPESYFMDNSVHDSYFRCYTVHGTSNVTVARNVAFRTTGHCFYLEDGVEENNTIEYNLAAHVNIIAPIATDFAQFMKDMPETPDRHLPADSAASGFYISNAWNIVRGNAASGGWAGFAYPLFKEPMGLSKGTAFEVPPKNKPSLVFDGNTAHSSGAYWKIFAGCVYSGGTLFYDDNGVLTYNGGRTMGASAKDPQIWLGGNNFKIVNFTITNLKVWSCGQGINHWGNNVLFQNSEVFDTGRGMTMFGPTYVYDSIITARTSNPMGYLKVGQQGWQFYDVWSSALLNNVTFVNFHRDTPPISDPNSATNCLTVLNNGPNPPYSRNTGISGVADLHFENTDVEVRVQMTNESNRRTSNIIDFDGSLTGISQGAVVGSDQPFWKVGSDCTFRSDWLAWVCPLTSTRTQISVGAKSGSTGLSGTVSLFGVDSELGTRTVEFNSDEYGATGLNSEGWYFNFGSATPNPVTFLPEKIPPGYKVIVGVSYPAGSTFNISYGVGWADPNGVYTKVNSINDVKNTLFSYYFDGTNLFFSLHNYFINPYYHHPDVYGRGDIIYGTDGQESVVIINASCAPCNANFNLPASLN